MDTNLIITIACAAATLTALIAALVAKTRGLKRITSLLKGKASLDEQRLAKIEELCLSTQKALILAQAKDAESRKALIDLLTERKPELKKQAEPVKERIDKKEQARKEVLSKVDSEYRPVD